MRRNCMGTLEPTFDRGPQVGRSTGRYVWHRTPAEQANSAYLGVTYTLREKLVYP